MYFVRNDWPIFKVFLTNFISCDIFYLIGIWGRIANLFPVLDGARACSTSGGGNTTTDCFSSRIRTLEINPQHPLIKDLLSLIKHSKDDKIILVCYDNFLNEIIWFFLYF
jgi:hypothetical protein